MKKIWVYKFDGTIQCDSDSSSISVDDMRAELEECVGVDNVLDSKRAKLTMVAACGAPTGAVNAYELSAMGLYLLRHGISPNPGFKMFQEPKARVVGEASIGELIGALTADNPILIRELPGHHLRVYQTGDALTKDHRSDRCNIELSQDHRIVQVWFG